MTPIASMSHGMGVVISRNPTEDGELHLHRVLTNTVVIGEIRARDCDQHNSESVGGYNLTRNCDTSVSTAAGINTLFGSQLPETPKKQDSRYHSR